MSDEKDSYKVLLIDDNKALLESLSQGLEHLCDLDFATVMAYDGLEALKLCEKNDFDAVITDYAMPNMDGLEFTKEFRKRTDNKAVPIIFTSAFFSELEMGQHKDLFENVTFIDKPYKFSKMNSFLKLHLESKKLGR